MKQIANFLKNFREKKGLTEKDIIAKTTLTSTVIHLIESGNFESIGAEFYIKSFLKQYCKVIGLTDSETDEIIQKVIKEVSKRRSVELRDNENKKGLFIWFSLILIILLVIFGFIFKSKEVKEDLGKKTHISVNNEKEKPISKLKEKPGQLAGENSLLSEKNEDFNKSSVKDNKLPNKQTITTTGSQEKNETLKQNSKKNLSEKTNNYSKHSVAAISKNEIITIKFEAKCMCWVNISYKGEVVKDFILQKNENFTIKVPMGAVLTIGNASCLTLYFNDRRVELRGEKVVRNLTVE